MSLRPSSAPVVACLPIAELPEGEIAPPLVTDHESWKVIAGWDDPLAAWSGYRVPSRKSRVEWAGEPAVEWAEGSDTDRALVTGQATWREYGVRCRMQALQKEAGPTNDDSSAEEAMAGLAVRIGTSRSYYYFCLQGCRRLALLRRVDDEWLDLAGQDVAYDGEIVELRVDLDGDGIRAACPELGVEFFVTDTLLREGRAGFRALGACRLFALEVTMTPGQEQANRRRAERRAARTARLGTSVPDEQEGGVLDLPDGGALLAASEFFTPGRNDLLLRTDQGLLAITWEGETLWRTDERPAYVVKVAAQPEQGGRRIYMLVGERKVIERTNVRGQPVTNAVPDEMVVIDGGTGTEIARCKLPESPAGEHLLRLDVSYETGRLATDRAVDICVREWRQDCGGGGRNVWAFDGDLNLLWRQEVDPPYGHHNAVHMIDLNGDGRDEVLAGGTLISTDGDVIAVHDLKGELARIRGAGHYDAVVAGFLGDDPEHDPVAALMAGSAGVYIINPLTGRTRAVHRIGHAQWGLRCRMRDDLPGEQILAGTRWGNMGIVTLLSGRGERLWSIQPDYYLQGSQPVQWTAEGPQHFWLCTSTHGQGLYDGCGRLVKPLDAIRALRGDGPPTDIGSTVLRKSPDGQDLLAVTIERRVHLFGPKQ